MQLGTVTGKTTTRSFTFEAESRVKKSDYVALKDPEGEWVLASIEGISTDGIRTRADAKVIGYRDNRGFLKTPKIPFSTDTPVFTADEDFIKETLGLRDSGAYIGLLEGYSLKVRIPIENMVKKHVSVLAKTGAGKSYLTGVIMEELAEHKIPVVVIDPHGEYYTLQFPNSKPSERKFMQMFGIEPKSYRSSVQIFGLRTGKEIRLNSRLSVEEICNMMPAKLPANQKNLLYTAVRNLENREYSISDIIDEVGKSRSQAKWDLISSLEFLMKTGLFSSKPTNPEEIVQQGKISIIDLKEARPEIQQMVVLKLAEDLFSARKRGKIPPFLFVLEEAHNFCPERGFGEVASSKILRTVASEGRKFGMGLMVVSQRPARVDKNILSQCNTQFILKVTNPNDLKAIGDSVESLGSGARDEIRDLPVGSAMIVGVTEHPLIVDIRIRRSEHGGDTVKMQQRVVEEDETPESIHLMFPPKVSKEDIISRYRGIDAVDLLKYPIWRVFASEGRGQMVFYIDGITGEMVYEKGDSIERSVGLKKLASIPPEWKKILDYLKRHKLSSPERMLRELKIPKASGRKILREMEEQGLIKRDRYMVHSGRIEIPEKPLPIHREPAEISSHGLSIEFSVTQDEIKKICSLIGMEFQKAEPVYYPYWVIKRKGRKTLVDAILDRIDAEATETVKDRV